MNTRKIFGYGLIAAILVSAFAVLSLTGCEQPTDTPTVTLTGITAAYSGTAVVFPTTPLNDLKTGLTVTATYSDSTTKTLTAADYTLSGTLAVGASTVTVTYQGKTDTFDVTVADPDGPPILISITANYTPTTAIFPDTPLDSLKTDLTVTAKYSDDSETTLATTDYTLSGTLAEGNSTVTVTYQGKTDTFDVTVNAPHAHNWGNWSETTAPTCTEPGIETRTCSASPSHDETRPVAALGHDWDEWEETTAPLCEVDGEETRICKHDSDHQETRSVDALGHDYQGWTQTTPPTCTTAGIETGTCTHDPTHTTTRTGDPIDPDAHDWGEWSQTTAPTCTTTGIDTRICSHNAAHTETRVGAAIDPNAHDYQWAVTATETEDGEEGYFCTHDPSHKQGIQNAYATGTAGLAFEIINGNAYRVSKGTATSVIEIYIPAMYRSNAESQYLPVTEIGNAAFAWCSSLTAVTIPSSVTFIGNQAFNSCGSLITIEIPASVTSIGDFVFAGSSNLTSIIVDANNLNYASQDGILYNNAKTEMITVPAGISGTVTIPDGVTSIGDYTFNGCHNLIEIIIPASVSSIGGWAFRMLDNFTNIVVDANSLHYASQDGILYNKAKTEILAVPQKVQGTVTIPNGVTSIDDYVFQNCGNLIEITIPDSVISIGSGAFQGCYSLTSIAIPSSVTSIGIGAFEYCSNLTSVIISANVVSIGSGAFSSCSSLTSVTFEAGSNITSENFGAEAFPQGSGYGGNNLKTAYLEATTKSGTYTRDSSGNGWTKE